MTKTAEASIQEYDDQLVLLERHTTITVAEVTTPEQNIINPEADEADDSPAQINAHGKLFEHVCDYVQRNVIRGSQVERMTKLFERYCLYMQTHSPEFYYPQYKNDNLKHRSKKYFGQRTIQAYYIKHTCFVFASYSIDCLPQPC